MADRIPDYNDLHEEYEAARERRLRKYPRCSRCKERIVDDVFNDFDGDFICEDCLAGYISDNFKVKTDDYLED
jgi:formylmethanofuran dehydrogenase subunit E